ncbi:bestrophin family protein [Aquimarina latercula]|uniref:bestrophin family protein n=1 Tax=Aquimarina latercula TaxID=987 RepID=UPI00040146A3|nr:bestrophin family ion channel [Aquimarina latercula]
MITNKRIPLSYPLGLIKWDLLFTIIFSTIIHFLSREIINFSLPIGVGAFLGTAIALILSFKLSQSYDRWWEARKIWGAIVNDSRSLIIQILNLNIKRIESETVEKIAYRQIFWCYSLGQNLRKKDALKDAIHYISKDELEKIHTHKNIPLVLLNNHSSDIRKLHQDKYINDYQQTQIDSTIVRLTASMGMAERIKNTIFPKPYRLTLQFFIYLFVVILAFSLTELDSLIEIPILVLIALPFFLLEKIALNMQDPFENKPTDTSVTSIARTIEINIKEILEEKNIPEPLTSDTFYIL